MELLRLAFDTGFLSALALAVIAAVASVLLG